MKLGALTGAAAVALVVAGASTGEANAQQSQFPATRTFLQTTPKSVRPSLPLVGEGAGIFTVVHVPVVWVGPTLHLEPAHLGADGYGIAALWTF